MPVSNRIKNQHLLWRSAFGPMAENVALLDNYTPKKLWRLLLETSKDSPKKISVASDLADGLTNGIQGISQMQKAAEMTKDQKRMLRRQYRDDLKNLNLMWMDEMINSKAQLREKMSLFWHGHFAARVVNSYFQQELLDVIRNNALGSFATLLKEVSKSPSMLQFLNNQQNKKGHPNENFAREVMELFTMGRGNYSETDVKEAARAFTGWGFDKQGHFIFRQNLHDDGTKTFLGKTGNFDGDAILDILLEQPATAQFITRKIYRYFINDNVDENRVKSLSSGFHNSGYDIKKLLEDIYTSDWFYEPQNIGSRIKSPVELLVGIRRFLPITLDKDESQLLFQKVLGQILFYPPNVAGWPGGKSWIDSSTLMVRMQIPQVWAAKENITVSPKVDDDVNMGMKKETPQTVGKPGGNNLNKNGASGNIEWPLVIKAYDKISREQLAENIANSLWQTPSRINSAILTRYIDDSSREAFIKSAVINLMSTPEYQLC